MISTDDLITKIIPSILSGGGLYKLLDHWITRRYRNDAKSKMNSKQLLNATQGAVRKELFRRVNALEKMVLSGQRTSKFWERKYNLVHDQLVELRADYRIVLNQLSVLKAQRVK